MTKIKLIQTCIGNSLAVQWLGLHAFTAKGMGSIPGQGTKIPQATQYSKNKTKENKNKYAHNLPCSKKKTTFLDFILKCIFITL